MVPRWRLLPHEPERIVRLSRLAGLPPLVAHLLLNRGIEDPALARTFLEARHRGLHDPELLPGAVDAAARIVNAIRADRPIVIYGDYDVDGTCGTSLLVACLRLAGAKHVTYYIPHRIDEGYGLNGAALEKLAGEQPGALIVTVDCGITAVNEAKRARELGLELIVTDHHELADELPDADVLVHPRLPGSTYPHDGLCGCGVAFKLAWQVCKSFGDGKKSSPHMRDFLIRALNFVALATVADVMPLKDENRVFVRHGLLGLLSDPSVGMKALLTRAGCLDRKRLNSGTIGFNLAPRINAAGRMHLATEVVELLTTSDPERARELAESLEHCNIKRQAIERAMVDEARDLIERGGGHEARGGLVIGREGWHPGVIGIVAGRLVDLYHRPAIVLAINEGQAQGSARSIPGFDLIGAIRACGEGLTGYGGHRAAAGLRMPAEHLPVFADRFEAYCQSHIPSDQREKTLTIDAEVLLGELSLKLVEAIEQLEPFGIGNPRPLLMAEDVMIAQPPRLVGEHQNHLSLRLKQGQTVMKAIAWNQAPRAAELPFGTRCSIAFVPSINEWNGRREVQLEIKDVRLVESATTRV